MFTLKAVYRQARNVCKANMPGTRLRHVRRYTSVFVSAAIPFSFVYRSISESNSGGTCTVWPSGGLVVGCAVEDVAHAEPRREVLRPPPPRRAPTRPDSGHTTAPTFRPGSTAAGHRAVRRDRDSSGQQTTAHDRARQLTRRPVFVFCCCCFCLASLVSIRWIARPR